MDNNDNINWNEYNFNFDGEFGAQSDAQPRPDPRAQGQYSLDELRRLHNNEMAQEQYVPPFPEQDEDLFSDDPVSAETPPVTPHKKRRRRHSFWGVVGKVLLIILLLLVLLAAVLWFTQKMPQGENAGLTRREDCCTVLLAGTDESGIRTDTLMVLYIDRAEKQIRLLSIPRDTMVNRDNPVPKINGAYYANGAGEKGMGFLMDYVKDVIGYCPDGYMLIDLDCFEDLVDMMGGVTFDVPMDMYYADPTQDLYIDLKAGKQKLNGKEAMWLVRFRSGYVTADLQRMSVQRDFLSAALSQWKKPWNLVRVPAVLALLQKNTLTDMKWNNLTWLGFSAVLCGTDNLETDTLPGDGAYVNGGAYYVEDRAAAAALVNEKYNPYEEEITAYDLHPYGY